MSPLRNFSLIALTAAALQVGTALTAEAKIQCDGPYQLSGGYSIRTPYCEDNYLAYVARSYGISVSGAEIRHNYNAKKHVCQVIGHDIRVSQICIGARPEGRKKVWVP
ncbi:MAG: hypothetical protein R3D57_14560 [Hyphomicrobiaceae bacterium]